MKLTEFKHSAEMTTNGFPMIMMSDPNSAPILMSDKGRQSYIDGAEVKHLIEGEDYIFVDVKPQKKVPSDLEETFESVTDLMNIQAACNPSEKERGKLLSMIDALAIADLEDQLELFEEDIAGVMLDKMYQTISGE